MMLILLLRRMLLGGNIIPPASLWLNYLISTDIMWYDTRSPFLFLLFEHLRNFGRGPAHTYICMSKKGILEKMSKKIKVGKSKYFFIRFSTLDFDMTTTTNRKYVARNENENNDSNFFTIPKIWQILKPLFLEFCRIETLKLFRVGIAFLKKLFLSIFFFESDFYQSN